MTNTNSPNNGNAKQRHRIAGAESGFAVSIGSILLAITIILAIYYWGCYHVHNKEAKATRSEAQTIWKDAKVKLESATANSDKAMSALGETKLAVLGGSVNRYLDAYDKLVVMADGTAELGELRKTVLDRRALEELRGLSDLAKAIADNQLSDELLAGTEYTSYATRLNDIFVKAVAAGTVPTMAIIQPNDNLLNLSNLPGLSKEVGKGGIKKVIKKGVEFGAKKAADNLELMGEGAKAVETNFSAYLFGTQGGKITLSAAAPSAILFTAGIAASILASEGAKRDAIAKMNLLAANEKMTEVKQFIKEAKSVSEMCEKTTECANLYNDLLKKLDESYLLLVEELEDIVEQKSSGKYHSNAGDKLVILNSANFTKEIMKLLNTPILLEDGKYDKKSMSVGKEVERFFSKNQKPIKDAFQHRKTGDTQNAVI